MHKAATLAGLVLLSAGGGEAQPIDGRAAPLPLFDYYDGDHLPVDAVGALVVNNEVRGGSPHWQHTAIETPHGPLLVRHRETYNIDCDIPCPDYVEVVETPPGLIADPARLEVAENSSDVIYLRVYAGF